MAATPIAAAVAGTSAPLSSATPSRVYRILHLTDIHFTVRPTWRECWAEPKRVLGVLNHALLGRSAHFSRGVQQQLVSEVYRQQPNHLVISGDLTSFATDTEFELAYDTLKPVLRPAARPFQLNSGRTDAEPAFSSHHDTDNTAATATHCSSPSPLHSSAASPTSSHPSYAIQSQPSQSAVSSFRTLLVGGNHDVYTFGSVRARLLDRWFGHWRLPTARVLSVAPDLHFVAIDACQPNTVSSHGHVDSQQLSMLRSTLSSPSLRSGFVVLVSHYPLLDRDGGDYAVRHPWHGIDNNSQLSDVLRETMAPLLATEQQQQQQQQQSDSQASPQAAQRASRTEDGVEAGVRREGTAAAGTAAMLLHGHVHRGYTVPFLLSVPPPSADSSQPSSSPASVSFPIYNPGSAGRSFSSGRRAAAYNVYTISRDETAAAEAASSDADSGCCVHRMNGWRLAVERFVHNGQTFEREQHGPYTTPY